ncbi:PrgI family protein [Candidatus Kuenenbacteria bacterium]|nr:PrgI family protein [Candidatus Kuenenbacteria bacterium]
MNQFLVPQFIDVEDKIIGPVTTRQFVIMLAALLVAFICYKVFAFLYFIAAAVFSTTILSILAFAKVNGRPIHYFLLNFVQTLKRSKLRVWNREAYINVVREVASGLKETKVEHKKKDPVSGSRLRDLSLMVNTGGVYEGQEISDHIDEK